MNNILDDRVGRLEVGFAAMQTDMHVLKSDVGRMQSDLSKLTNGIERLLERESRRPEALSWGKVGATVTSTLGVMGALWFAVTWLVDHASVAHREISEKRFTVIEGKVDDATEFVKEWSRHGRLLFIEDRVRRLDGGAGAAQWGAVTRPAR